MQDIISTSEKKILPSFRGKWVRDVNPMDIFRWQTKSFQRIKGEDIITPPKTEKGIRRVLMPAFYADKMQVYIESLQLNETDRIFLFTKSYLHHEIRRGCAASGVKRMSQGTVTGDGSVY